MSDLITADLVDLDLHGADRHEATATLAAAPRAAGRVTDVEGFLADVRAREEQMPTGPRGRHRHPARRAAPTSPCRASRSAGRRTASTSAPTTAPPTSIFLIAAPEGGGAEHMTDPRVVGAQAHPPGIQAALRDARREAVAA